MIGPPPHEVAAVLDALASGAEPDRPQVRAAVKAALAELSALAPGRSVEVRVPPHAAVQVVAGSTHRRGTPAAVVEMDARTWLDLAVGRRSWDEAVAAGDVIASGARSDLGALLPLFTSP